MKDENISQKASDPTTEHKKGKKRQSWTGSSFSTTAHSIHIKRYDIGPKTLGFLRGVYIAISILIVIYFL